MQREIEIMRPLTHKNIVTMLDSFETEREVHFHYNPTFFIMKWEIKEIFQMLSEIRTGCLNASASY